MSKRILKNIFSLLNVDHVILGVKWNYKNVISPYYRLYYIDAGDGEISDLNTNLQLEPGYLYIIPSFTLCSLTCQNYMSQYFIQFFEESSDGISLFANNRSVFKMKATEIDVKNFARILEINPGRGINRSDNPKIYEKNVFYKEYQDLNNQQSMGVFLETQGIILQLISRFLIPSVFKHREVNQIPLKVLDTISYIQINLDKQLTVAQLAQRANLNVEYFSRLFYKYTGERPINYIHEKRIERAQYLIVTTQMTLEQIATQTGFENIYYFSKVFKKITGTTPGSYKKQTDSNHL